jgi:fucose permease
MPQRSNELSGLMVTAIVGGAFIPPLMGFVADQTTVMLGFAVPMICILYIAWLAFSNKKMAAEIA